MIILKERTLKILEQPAMSCLIPNWELGKSAAIHPRLITKPFQ